MEAILSLFIFHDVYVVSILVAVIMVVVIWLLMSNFKSPESVVMGEIHSNDDIEGALRRVLGEKSWVGASSENGDDSDGGGDSLGAIKKIGVLEKEVLTKDKEIAELHKQITQGIAQNNAGEEGDNSELMGKIDELEARLLEYEIIEDDIADLSLYKAENEKLKSELEALQSGDLQDDPVEPEEEAVEPASVAEPEPESEPELKVDDIVEGELSTEWEAPENSEDAGRDLVAEFEKVVNNKDAIVGEPEEVVVQESPAKESGDIKIKAVEDNGSVEVIHEKLKDIKPDSKEEAEIFINDLKSLKKGS